MNINLAELNFYVCYESKSLPPLDTDSTVNCLLHARLVVPLFGREKKISTHRSRARSNLFKTEYPHSLTRGS